VNRASNLSRVSASLVGVTALLATTLTALAVPGAHAGPPPAPAAAAPMCKGRPATIVGTDASETLRGTPGRDVILALGGDDRVEGRDGVDLICGGSGRDLIQGGRGDDKLFAGADGRSDKVNGDGVRLMVGDVVQGGKGDDLIDLGFDARQVNIGSDQRDRLSYKASTSAVQVRLGSKRRGAARGDGHDVLVKHPYLALLGSNLGDELSGSMFGDQILGRGGRDRIEGAGGRDVLVDGPIGATSGDDVLLGGLGRDELTTHGGHDKLDGGFSADAIEVIRAPLGALTVGGGPGNDTLVIGLLVAGACPDVIGGEGTDELLPTVAGAIHRGKADIDLQSSAFGLRGAGGDSCGTVATVENLTIENPFGTNQRIRWFVRGTSAAETLILRNGGSTLATMAGGNDRVIASSGDDNMKGGPGDDRLFGGPGRDVAMGGSGTDTCREAEFEQGCELPD
jgi:Ca2+-binding RTX toxin-like protein